MIPGYHRPEAGYLMTPHEVAALLYAAKRRGPLDNGFSYFAFSLQYLLAMRVSEVAVLRYEHLGSIQPVQLANGTVVYWPKHVMVPTVKKKNPALYQRDKTTNLPILPVPVLSHGSLVAAAFDKRHRAGDAARSPWLFPGKNAGTHVSRSHLISTFNELLEDAGLEDHFSTHTLRHTAATRLYEKVNRRLMVTRFLRQSDGRDAETGRNSVTDRYIHLSRELWRCGQGALDLPKLAPLAKKPVPW